MPIFRIRPCAFPFFACMAFAPLLAEAPAIEGPSAPTPPSAGPASAQPSPPADRPATYGMSVQLSLLTIMPYEYDNVVAHSWPQVPPGPLKGNREMSLPFALWYYNDAARLRFEFGASRYIARNLSYDSIADWNSSGGHIQYITHSSLSSVSRSFETFQILRPVPVGSTTFWIGGGAYHLLRESPQSTGSNGTGYNRTRSLGIRACVRWEIPIRSFALELSGASYSGPARVEPAPYLYVAPDLSYASTVLAPGSVPGIVFALQAGITARYRLDEHVSLSLGYEYTGELREIQNYDRVSAYARSSGSTYISAWDLNGLPIPASGRVHDHERLYGYSLGVTLQL